MGRPEKFVDPEAGAVQWLPHELRELRRAAGGPSYRVMVEASASRRRRCPRRRPGERLSSLAVVQGYVRACGGDPEEW
ncbi:hypothetical protein [Streptomyces sp. SD31]|uniref:hypothetical protein n=1 Tax=Streptomyces sp. SD31 TaxID=3452208 RepID=UPI003F8C3511